jgi:hypothetical protein
VIDRALLGRIEEVPANRLAGQRLEHQGRDELLRRRRQDTAHRMAGPAQGTNQLGGLVGGDAARHADQDATLLHRHAP